MNAELFESVRPAAERVGWVLVHSTWEGAAVAAGLWVVLAVVGRTAARARYAACCAALAAVVVAMGVTFARVEGTPRAVAPAGVSGTPVAVELRVADVPVAVENVAPAKVERRRPVAPSWDVRRLIAPWLPGVVGAWAVGVMGLAAWHLGGWVKLRRMARAGVAGEWEERVGRIARRLGVSRGVQVVESALAGVPAVVGFVRPVILLPVGLAAEMSVGQVEAILAHELAHVRRNDYLVNLVQTAIETLLFYHPAVWWISGQIRQEREHCCDDLAVAACGGDRAGYARALARVEELRAQGMRLAPAVDGGGSLLKRVRRIAVAESRGGRRATPVAALLAAVACAGAVLVAAEWPAKAADRARAAAAAAAATHPATTRSAGAEGRRNGTYVVPVRPEDLVPTEGEYRIGAGDLLAITVRAADGERDLTRRVGDDGKVNLPGVGGMTAAGTTAAELGKAVAEAMGGKASGGDVRTSVRVTEARRNVFRIWGTGVNHAGEYPITKPDFRLSDAFAAAVVSAKRGTVRVSRGHGDDYREIAVPVAAVLAGDPKVNLVVRRADLLIVDDPDRRFIRVVVGRDTLTLDGKPADLAEVEQALRDIPAGQRARADVSVWAESDDVPVGRLMWVVKTCDFEARRLGIPGAQNRGVQNGMKRTASTQPATKPAEVIGSFYVGGRVREPGVYGINSEGITLARALESAGVRTEGPAFVTVVRRIGDRQAFPVDGVPVRDVFGGPAGGVAVRSGDRVVVTGEKPTSAGRATEVLPAPHAGAVGEVYIGGHVRRPGVYSVTGRKVTLAGLVTMALGPDNDAADLTEVRRREAGHETVTRVSIREVLDATEPDLYLQPKDVVNVGVAPPSPGAAGK